MVHATTRRVHEFSAFELSFAMPFSVTPSYENTKSYSLPRADEVHLFRCQYLGLLADIPDRFDNLTQQNH